MRGLHTHFLALLARAVADAEGEMGLLSPY